MSRILLVDDDSFVREALTRALRTKGFDVEEAATLEAAEAYIETEPKLGAIVLDLWLGDRSGLELLQNRPGNSENVPIIAISGGGPGRTLEQAVAMADALNASAVLMKPFHNSELFGALQAVGLDV